MFGKNIEQDYDLPRRPQRLCGEKSGFPCGAQNSGIVLIIVLGMLTVMVLLAVSFAVSMRTERLAAGNAADTVRARQLIHVGLARAMNDLANNLGTNGLYSTISGVHVGKAYPDWSVTNSAFTNVSGSGAARFPTNVYLVRGEATNYVPRALWTDATNADNLSPSNHWLPVESLHYDGGVLVESNLMGRVAYLIVNCSGLLDANYAGGAAGGRQLGTNPQEIALGFGYLNETKVNFSDDRKNTHIRYETVAELNALAGINKPATNLFVYSRALPGYWKTNVNPALNCVGTQVNLSGSADQLVLRREHITNALANAGFTTYESCALYSNLIDYVDGDSIPSNFEYCVENVPMINEIVCTNIIVSTPGPPVTYHSEFHMYVEWWDPFLPAAANPCVLSNFIDFSNNGGGTAALVPPDTPNSVAINNAASPKIRAEAFPVIVSGNANDDNASFTAVISSYISKNGAVVDKVIVTGIFTTAAGSVGFECNDPRINGLPVSWRTEASSTLNSPNNYCGALSPTNDGDFGMFVSNGTLHSVADLGCLVYSAVPWKTVKLYGPDRHRVLDVFGISTNLTDVLMTNIIYRGLVNCNSNVASNATAVVFAGMPVDQYPGGPSTALGMPEAQSFISGLFAGGICTNLSDVGRNLLPSDFTIPAGITELQREAYFRNAFNLINLRQNMFTIIIEAQAASSGNIARNPAKQRAVAIVWRDPYTGEMFVRHVKWLGD